MSRKTFFKKLCYTNAFPHEVYGWSPICSSIVTNCECLLFADINFFWNENIKINLWMCGTFIISISSVTKTRKSILRMVDHLFIPITSETKTRKFTLKYLATLPTVGSKSIQPLWLFRRLRTTVNKSCNIVSCVNNVNISKSFKTWYFKV